MSAARRIKNTVGEINYWHRQHMFAGEQREHANVALLKYLSTLRGSSLALPEKEREGFVVQAIVGMGENPDFLAVFDLLRSAIASRKPFDMRWYEVADILRAFELVERRALAAEGIIAAGDGRGWKAYRDNPWRFFLSLNAACRASLWRLARCHLVGRP